ncbi:MAG: DoxX family protein [Mucilaginibacter sp.]|nr:DoxX family protein [Mucilaginibacter sp.]
MTSKTIRILYWVLTILFSVAMLMDGYGGISQQEAGKEVLRHLGYPMYTLIIFGIAKVIGAIIILQTKFKTIKEWAYAGFTINFIGAAASRAFMGDGIGLIVMPLIILFIMFLSYWLWKKFEQTKNLKQQTKVPAI